MAPKFDSLNIVGLLNFYFGQCKTFGILNIRTELSRCIYT
jgi:hypothetical protein